MEIYERIRILRKSHLKLSQTEFAEKLGVTRSVINNIERNVLARPDQKEPFYRLICSTFNVSYDWLTAGTEPMFVEQKSDFVEQLVERYNGDEILRAIVTSFMKLTEAEQAAVLKFVESLRPEAEGDKKIFRAASSEENHPDGATKLTKEEQEKGRKATRMTSKNSDL